MQSVVDRHGRIILAGLVDRGFPYHDTLVVRLTPEGLPDPAFDTDGIVERALSPVAIDRLEAVTHDRQDRVVLAGYMWLGEPTDDPMFVMRLSESGGRDRAFGTDGVVEHEFAPRSYPMALGVQSTGRLLVVMLTSGAGIGSPSEGFVVRLWP